HLEGFHHAQRAADVIAVLVAEDDEIEAPDARAAQRRHDDARAAVRFGSEGGPRVVEERVPGRAHGYGQPLADIESRDPRLAGPRPREREAERRRHQRKPARAPGHAARRERPRRAGERGEHRPYRRHVLLPERARERGTPFEEDEQPLYEERAEPEQR